MIGWERPPLDELGYSNGTFVYGYRVGKQYIGLSSFVCVFLVLIMSCYLSGVC